MGFSLEARCWFPSSGAASLDLSREHWDLCPIVVDRVCYGNDSGRMYLSIIRGGFVACIASASVILLKEHSG